MDSIDKVRIAVLRPMLESRLHKKLSDEEIKKYNLPICSEVIVGCKRYYVNKKGEWELIKWKNKN